MEKTKRNWLIALIAVAAAVLIAGGVTAGVLVAKGRSAKTVYNSAESGLRAYETLELGVELPKTYKNPYDSAAVEVNAVIKHDGGEETVPMFWYEDYERSLVGGVEKLTETGRAFWMLRYLPKSAGEYRISVSVKENGKKKYTDKVASVSVSAGNADGYLRVAADKTHLEFDNGEAFNGVGHNLCGWEFAGGDNMAGTYDYDRWLNELATNGANLVQFDLCEGDNLEWTRRDGELPYSEGYGGVRRFNPQTAWKTDYKVKSCESLGIYFRFSLYHWEDFDNEGDNNFPDWGWNRNPYNSANGGPADNVTEFFETEESRAATKNYFRYCVARWGYSPNLVMWELWNEADAPEVVWAAGDSYYNQKQLVSDWHREMAEYIKSLDVNKHLVTTSFANAGNGDEVWKLDCIDVTTFHRYTMYNDGTEGTFNGVKALYLLVNSRLGTYGKPVIAGEFALSPAGDIQRENDKAGIGFHNQIWASVFAGSFGTAMHWNWDSYLDRNDLYYHYKPLSDFLRYEDLRGAKTENNIMTEEEALYMSMTAGGKGYIWVKDRNYDYYQVLNGYQPKTVSGASVTLKMADGAYKAEFFDTYTGAKLSEADLTAANGSLNVAVPDFVKDVAVKITPAEQIYTAAALAAGGGSDEMRVLGDRIELYATGADIGGMSDAGLYAYVKVSGDFDYTARIDRVSYTGEFSKAGVMMRVNTSPSGKMAFVGMNGAGDVSFISRKGMIAEHGEWQDAFVGAYVKIERRGDMVRAYLSADGREFIQIGEAEFVNLKDEVLIGVAASSKNTLGYNESAFGHVSLIKK